MLSGKFKTNQHRAPHEMQHITIIMQPNPLSFWPLFVKQEDKIYLPGCEEQKQSLCSDSLYKTLAL